MRIVYTGICLLMLLSDSLAQLSLIDSNADTIDFEKTVIGISNGQFTGSGLVTSPSSGQLDSDGWEIIGLSDGDLLFSGSGVSSDYTRGVSAGGVSSGGVYAFDISGTNANHALGIQATTGDYTPGSTTLKIVNNTGTTLDSLKIDYKLLINNDGDRSQTIDFSHSSDNVNYTGVPALSETTVETNQGSVMWVTFSKSTTIQFGTPLPNGANYYLKWTHTENGGASNRDEIAIDDIILKPYLPIPPACSAVHTTSLPSCNGGTDGMISLFPTGGTVYTYSWSNGKTTQNITGVGAGTYVATIIADGTCTITENVTLTEPLPLSITVTPTHESVSNASDGMASVQAGGGTPGYSYNWNISSSSGTISGLVPGSYSVTVTDNNSCTASGSTTVEAGGCPQYNSVNIPITITDLSVSTSTIIVPPGGTISDVNVLNLDGTHSFVGDLSMSLTSPQGTTVALLARQCAGADNFNLNFDDAATLGAPSCPLTGGNTYTSVGLLSAFNGEDGQGVWTLSIEDHVNGDEGVLNSWSLQLCRAPSPFSCSLVLNATDIACNGNNDGVIAAVPGGSTSYTYTWSNGATTQNISGLSVGVYTLTMVGDGICTVTGAENITEPSPITFSISATDETLTSANDGTATGSISGGTPGYSYQWNTGANTSSISGLSPGIYSLTATDGNSCPKMGSVTVSPGLCGEYASTNVPVTITDHTIITSTLTVPAGGTITDVDILNLTGTHTFVGDLSISITSPQGTVVQLIHKQCTSNSNFDLNFDDAAAGTPSCPLTGGGTYNAVGLLTSFNGEDAAGVWTLSVEDSGTGDQGTLDSWTLRVCRTPPPPPPCNITLTATNIDCNGNNNGQIALTPSGGTNYVYNWSNGASSQNLSSLSVGNYSVTMIADGACTVTESTAITEPTALSFNSSVTDLSCGGDTNGSASIYQVTGGPSGVYSYLWSNNQTSASINGLSGGVYPVTITSGVCSSMTSVSINEPANLMLTIQCVPTSGTGNSDGAANTTVIGGTSPYSYMWHTGANSANLSNLGAGAVSATVTDSNGCIATDNCSVLDDPCANVSVSISSNNVSCNGANDGGATAVMTGSTSSSFSYSWSNASNNATLSALGGGSYSVTVIDGNGCEETSSVTLAEPSALSITLLSTGAGCNGGTDGSVSVDAVTGGPSTSYTYIWNTGETTSNITGLSAGSFTVTVVSGVCLDMKTEVVAGPGADSIEVNASICIGETYFAGGTNQTTAGVYYDTFVGSTGCDSIVETTLEVSSLSLSITESIDINSCTDTLTAVSPTATSYTWQTPSGEETTSVVVASIGETDLVYNVTVTDTFGCSDSANVTVEGETKCGTTSLVHSTRMEGVKVYPNPNNGMFSFELLDRKNGEYRVLDVMGKTVLQGVTSNNVERVRLNVQSGVYFLELRNGHKKEIIKIMVN